MLLVWRIWRNATKTPEQHAIQTRVSRLPVQPSVDRILQFFPVIVLIASILIALLQVHYLPAFLLFSAVIIPLLLIIFNGALLGMFLVSRTAWYVYAAINAMRELLAVIPDGLLGSAWIIVQESISQEPGIQALSRVFLIFLLLTGGLLLIAVIGVLILWPDQSLLLGLIAALSGILFLAMDHLYGLVMSLMLGLLSPMLFNGFERPGVAAFGLFIFVHSLLYAVGIAMLILLTDLIPVVFAVLITLGVYYFLREFLLRGTLRLISHIYGSGPELWTVLPGQ